MAQLYTTTTDRDTGITGLWIPNKYNFQTIFSMKELTLDLHLTSQLLCLKQLPNPLDIGKTLGSPARAYPA